MKLIIFILALGVGACSWPSGKKQETKVETRQELPKNVFGLDVRTGFELRFNPAPGAHHIGMSDLQTTKDLPKDKSRPIYVFCESGVRAKSAKRVLEARGYSNVKNIRDWRTWNKMHGD